MRQVLVKKIEPMTISWESALERVSKRDRIILILGATDTGKTTLTKYLANGLLRRGRSVSLVDADVGQSDIGPPTTIAIASPKEPFYKFSTLSPVGIYFIGSISPVGHLLPMLVGTKLMVEQAKTQHVLIDTTGLISGLGKALKAHKIELLDPDLILALQREEELEPILNRNFAILRV